MAQRVTAIPATLNRFTSMVSAAPRKRKTAGYARVSTELEEQQSSYENQIRYYSNYIQSRSDWEFVGIYTDEGITATNTKRRDGFNRMVNDALAGKIDLIITKSISRFARNTVDSLTTIRKLKDKGVEVYFEKENIWTFDSKCELLITIMSSLAQEESRSISENTTWGKRKSFADGKVYVAYSHFLGYDEGFVINEKEAEAVRLMYKLFLSGLSIYAISKELQKRGMKTPFGNDHWTTSTIKSILTNEKYKGDALLQKQFTVDFLSKKKKLNQGEVQQYYVEAHHPAIIDPATFDLVQEEFQRRYDEGRPRGGSTIFAAKIRCGECGGWYGSKIWHSTDKYRKIVYRCNKKYSGEKKCETPALSEHEIKTLFMKAVRKLSAEKDEVISNLNILRDISAKTNNNEEELRQLVVEIAGLEAKLREHISINARAAQDQSEYDQQYMELSELYKQKLARKDELENVKKSARARDTLIGRFIEQVQDLEVDQGEFDEELWAGIVDIVTVNNKEKVTFTFVGGIEIEINR